jgi:hypothetical protein
LTQTAPRPSRPALSPTASRWCGLTGKSAPTCRPPIERKVLEHFESRLENVSAVIFEDYAKGVLSQKLLNAMQRLAHQARKITAADPNSRSRLRYSGLTAVTPNRSEAFAAAGFPPMRTGGRRPARRGIAARGPNAVADMETPQPAGHAGRTRHVPVPSRQEAAITSRRSPKRCSMYRARATR